MKVLMIFVLCLYWWNSICCCFITYCIFSTVSSFNIWSKRGSSRLNVTTHLILWNYSAGLRSSLQDHRVHLCFGSSRCNLTNSLRKIKLSVVGEDVLSNRVLTLSHGVRWRQGKHPFSLTSQIGYRDEKINYGIYSKGKSGVNAVTVLVVSNQGTPVEFISFSNSLKDTGRIETFWLSSMS